MLPLANRRVIVTRAAERAGTLIDALRRHGATPFVCPMIASQPLADPAALDAALARLADYDWLIVTSAAAVDALTSRRSDLHQRRPRRIGAVGPATAAALAHAGLAADLIPADYRAAGLLADIGSIAGQRVLLPQADIAQPELAAGLRAAGALVDVVVAYHTVPGDGVDLALELLRSGVDAMIFTSPSTIRSLWQGLAARGIDDPMIRQLFASTVIACIGPTTAAAAPRADVVAEPHTVSGLIAALIRYFEEHP
ncbi:MAG TPA: uroporphyrinogen-III synthase [Roseiflexaceae bacterium]|nr:uroporphyrinogen-III synthase [Roseiflexaceae bacterium]